MGAPDRVETGRRDGFPCGFAPRKAFALAFADGGVLPLGGRTEVMGVINVTPDSFSDGGRHLDPRSALDTAARMAAEGSVLLDVGGESTRPGAATVSAAEEANRVLPVVEAIKRRLTVRVSVDTMKAEVARQALDAGADLINDVSALGDPEMAPLLANRGAPALLMHMRGDPRTMQRETRYEDVVAEVVAYLRGRADSAIEAGIAGDKILLDPGIGFGKSVDGNLEMLKGLPSLGALGWPVVIGASRKSFIGRILDLPVTQRLESSLAVASFAAAQGAHLVRTHDVAATVRAVRMIDAIRDV